METFLDKDSEDLNQVAERKKHLKNLFIAKHLTSAFAVKNGPAPGTAESCYPKGLLLKWVFYFYFISRISSRITFIAQIETNCMMSSCKLVKSQLTSSVLQAAVWRSLSQRHKHREGKLKNSVTVFYNLITNLKSLPEDMYIFLVQKCYLSSYCHFSHRTYERIPQLSLYKRSGTKRNTSWQKCD